MNYRIQITLLFILTLVACGVPTPMPSTTATSTLPTTTLTSTEKIWTYQDVTVGFVQIDGSSPSPWRTARNTSFRESAEQLGITLRESAGSHKQENQISGLHTFIADEDVNVIVLSPLETTGWEKVLQEARVAGKIVILDSPIEAPEDLYTSLVSSDYLEQGRKAGRAMIEVLDGSDHRSVVELVGNQSSTIAVDRGLGFREAIQNSGIEIIYSEIANWNKVEGKQVMEGFLQESRDIQGVFAQNDEMALGAIEAIKEAGLRPGDDIKIVSIDATETAFMTLLAGELNVTVELNPNLAPQVYEAALKALNGETLPKFIPVNETVFFATDPDLAEIAANRKY